MKTCLSSIAVRRCRPLLPFISALAASVMNAAAADVNEPSYVCSGNEPFWRIEMNRTAAVLTRPGPDGIEQHM
ncbi:MAG: hypothetical protein ACXWWJ_09005, partial [Nitrospira sp.]